MATTARECRVWILAAIVVGLVLAPAVASAQEQPRKITRLAGRTTAISLEGANTLEALQSQIKKFEGDLRRAFAASGWDGDPNAFFQAVAEGKAEKTAVGKGELIEWMAFRDKDGPTVMSNLEWDGRRAIDAWEVQVVNGTKRARFIVPAICLNVSLQSEHVDAELAALAASAAQPPTCSVQATAMCETKTLRIQATSDVSVELTSVSLDGRPLSGARSAGAGTWELGDVGNGVYSIVATATKPNGVTGTCQGRVTVDCPVAVCSLAASYDETAKRIMVSSDGSVGEVTLTGVTVPDGSSGDLSKVESATPGSWSFNPRKTLPRATGDYSYTFNAQSSYEGETASCSATATVPVEAREDRWTLRLLGGPVNTDGEHVRTESTTLYPGTTQTVPERTSLDIGHGTVFGLGLEYQFTQLMGLELSAFFGDLDSGFMIDIGDLWGMDDDKVSYTPISLALNFHLLRPDAPVDFYLGPVIGLLRFGDATYHTLDTTYRRSFDDEFAYGVNLGIDVPFGSSRWQFNANARYFDTDVEVEGTGLEVPVDPLQFTAGVGIRF